MEQTHEQDTDRRTKGTGNSNSDREASQAKRANALGAYGDAFANVSVGGIAEKRTPTHTAPPSVFHSQEDEESARMEDTAPHFGRLTCHASLALFATPFDCASATLAFIAVASTLAIIALSLEQWAKDARRVIAQPGPVGSLDAPVDDSAPLDEEQKEQLLRDACRASLVRPLQEVSASVLAYSHGLTAAQLVGFLAWADERHAHLTRAEAGPCNPRLHRCRVVIDPEAADTREAYLKFVEPDASKFTRATWPIKPATVAEGLSLGA